MLEYTIYKCGMCHSRLYFYFGRRVVTLHKKECEKCHFRKTCPYFQVKVKKGVCPVCSRNAKFCGLKKI